MLGQLSTATSGFVVIMRRLIRQAEFRVVAELLEAVVSRADYQELSKAIAPGFFAVVNWRTNVHSGASGSTAIQESVVCRLLVLLELPLQAIVILLL